MISATIPATIQATIQAQDGTTRRTWSCGCVHVYTSATITSTDGYPLPMMYSEPCAGHDPARIRPAARTPRVTDDDWVGAFLADYPARSANWPL